MNFQQPACHLGHLAVGAAVGRTAAQQHYAGGGRIRHVEGAHGLAQAPLQDRQDRIAGGEMRRQQDLGLRPGDARLLDRFRDLHLDVAGRIQDQRHHQHAARGARGIQQGGVHLGRRELDEAQFDAQFGPARAPLRDEVADFLVARILARAVADDQDGVVRLQRDGGGENDGADGSGIHALAFRKRWVNVGS
jgi:hypothetical protein